MAQDRLAIDGAFVRTQALLDEQGAATAQLVHSVQTAALQSQAVVGALQDQQLHTTQLAEQMAAQVAQALSDERASTRSVLESQQQAAALQSQAVAQALHEQQQQTRLLAEQVAAPGVTPDEMESLRSQIAQLRVNSELEAAHYARKLDSERNAKHEAKRALDAMAGERAALHARLEEQRAAHTHAVAQKAEMSQQNIAAHALALRQEASDAANLALQAQLTTAMAMLGDLRRRVDLGESSGNP